MDYFFGSYSDGAQEAVEYELNLLDARSHFTCASSSALIFEFSDSPRAAGTLDVVFKLIGLKSFQVQKDSFMLDTVETAIHGIVEECVDALRLKLKSCSSWRASGIRKDTAGQRQNFRSKDLELLFTDAIRAAFGAARGDTLQQHSLPPVALSGFDLEFIVWVRGGLLAIGWTDSALSHILHPPTRLLVRKGESGEILSKAADATAFVLACIALRDYEAGSGQLSSGAELLCGDPMCGVGTCLFALHYTVSTHFSGARPACIGSDASEPSVRQARDNLSRLQFDPGRFAFVQCAAEAVGRDGAMPLNGVDLVIVDPPWGHRHGTFADICRRTPAWARQWVAVLRWARPHQLRRPRTNLRPGRRRRAQARDGGAGRGHDTHPAHGAQGACPPPSAVPARPPHTPAHLHAPPVCRRRAAVPRRGSVAHTGPAPGSLPRNARRLYASRRRCSRCCRGWGPPWRGRRSR